MGRIRTVKPEFFTSEQIAECSPNARLLFIGMWCFCDDYGVHPASVKRLKMEVFPADDFSTADVGKMVDELIANKLLTSFEAEGESYWYVTGWKHQYIEKRTKRHPAPEFANPHPNDHRPFSDLSANRGRTGAEHSPTVPRTGADRSTPEGKGRDRIGNGGEGNGGTNSPEPLRDSGQDVSPQAKAPEVKPAPKPPQLTPDPPKRPPDALLSFPIVGPPGEWHLTTAKLAEYRETFPDLDVLGECRKALQWTRDNRSNRKTAAGMAKFLGSWLSRAQNKGPRPGPGFQPAAPAPPQTHDDIVALITPGIQALENERRRA